MSSFLELKNQHLTQFHGIAENEKALFFVFEFAGEGPLDAYIKKEARYGSNALLKRQRPHSDLVPVKMDIVPTHQCPELKMFINN